MKFVRWALTVYLAISATAWMLGLTSPPLPEEPAVAALQQVPLAPEHHPDVRSIAVEQRYRKIDIDSPAPRWNTGTDFRVTLMKPIEPKEVDDLAALIRSARPDLDIVGVRFVLPDWPREDLDADVGQPFYAWKLYWPKREIVTNFSGLSPSAASAIASRIPTENIIGIWIDYYYPLGVFVLRQGNGRDVTFSFGHDLARRWRMVAEKGRGAGKRYRAADLITADGERYKADGVGTDALAVSITDDSRLFVYGGRTVPASKPYAIGVPLKMSAADSGQPQRP